LVLPPLAISAVLLLVGGVREGGLGLGLLGGLVRVLLERPRGVLVNYVENLYNNINSDRKTMMKGIQRQAREEKIGKRKPFGRRELSEAVEQSIVTCNRTAPRRAYNEIILNF